MLFNYFPLLIKGKVRPGPFLYFILLWCVTTVKAGEATVLPLNSAGRIEYSDTLYLESAAHNALRENAMEFLQTLTVPDMLTSEVELSDDLSELSQRYGFYVYHKPALTQQIDGVVLARITIRLREEGYSYSITDFQFIKYARNRFGKFAPETSRKYPIEKYYPDSNKKTWKAHFEVINRKMADLEQKMNAKLTGLQDSE